MNTKSLLLFIFLILFFLNLVDAGTQTNQSQADNSTKTFSSKKRFDTNQNTPFDMIDQRKNNHKPNDDDDGKSQHFHFQRLAKHRMKILFSLLGKFILLFAHISSLLMPFLQHLH